MTPEEQYIEDLEFSVLVCYVCSGLCTACLAAVLAAWWLAPRWRTLHNCVSLNQVAAGTLWQYCTCIGFLCILLDYKYDKPWLVKIYSDYGIIIYLIEIRESLRISMSCWSLFAIAYAYIKLVLLHRHIISCEKTTAIVMTYGLVIMIQTIVHVVEYVFIIPSTVLETFIINVIPIAMAALVWVLFIRICISVMCCRPAVSSRNRTHVMALVGVAVMCDTFDIVHSGVFMYVERKYVTDGNKNMYYMLLENILIALRVIMQTVFVLFKKTSRIQFKLYYMRLRNRVSNDIRLF